MTELFAAAVAIGFFGSLHCVGMCGGLVSALCLARPQLWWPGLAAYQLGRITTYAILGLLISAIGAGLSASGWFGQLQQILAWVAGGLMILFALYLGGWLPDPFARLASHAAQTTGLSGWMGRAANGKHLSAWFMVGLLNGLLPCGLVYAGLALSLRAAEPATGAMIMACFGLGTLPAMLAAPAVMHTLTPERRGHLLKFAAILLIALGLATIFRNALHQDHDHTGHGHTNIAPTAAPEHEMATDHHSHDEAITAPDTTEHHHGH